MLRRKAYTVRAPIALQVYRNGEGVEWRGLDRAAIAVVNSSVAEDARVLSGWEYVGGWTVEIRMMPWHKRRAQEYVRCGLDA